MGACEEYLYRYPRPRREEMTDERINEVSSTHRERGIPAAEVDWLIDEVRLLRAALEEERHAVKGIARIYHDSLIADIRMLRQDAERGRFEEREACAQLIHQRYEEVDSETGVEGELLRLEEAIRTRR